MMGPKWATTSASGWLSPHSGPITQDWSRDGVPSAGRSKPCRALIGTQSQRTNQPVSPWTGNEPAKAKTPNDTSALHTAGDDALNNNFRAMKKSALSPTVWAWFGMAVPSPLPCLCMPRAWLSAMPVCAPTPQTSDCQGRLRQSRPRPASAAKSQTPRCAPAAADAAGHWRKEPSAPWPRPGP